MALKPRRRQAKRPKLVSYKLERQAQRLRAKIAADQAKLQALESRLRGRAIDKAAKQAAKQKPLLGRLFNAPRTRRPLRFQDLIKLPKRRYQNPETGQVISRRQAEKLAGGRLKEKGFTSPEQQASATPPEVRATRPARGRGAKRPKNYTNIRPLQGRSSRWITDGSTAESYDGVLRGLIANRGVLDVSLAVSIYDHDNDRVLGMPEWLIMNTFPSDLPTGDQAVAMADNHVFSRYVISESSNIEWQNFMFYVRFRESVIRFVPKKPSTRKHRKK